MCLPPGAQAGAHHCRPGWGLGDWVNSFSGGSAVPAGPEHPQRAIQAAQNLLALTGHGDPKGPWVPVGIGIHTGLAFVGVVGGSENRPTDFTALGDNVNITARLASQAGVGEILISDAAYAAAGLDLGSLEHQQLELKGKDEPVGVMVLRN